MINANSFDAATSDPWEIIIVAGIASIGRFSRPRFSLGLPHPHPMASAHLVHFVPASRKATILDSSVCRIFAVAHENLGTTNHWCFYLQVSTSHCVQLDCQPSHSIPSTVLKGGSKANLIISELPYLQPPETEAHFALDVAPDLSVNKIYSYIIDNGRHRYEFDENGVGCRFWVTDQLDLFYQARLVVDHEQVARAKDGILKLWPGQTPNPLDCGAYYAESGSSSSSVDT